MMENRRSILECSKIYLYTRTDSIRGIVLVDNEDCEFLSQWIWRLHTGGYAFRNQRVDGKLLGIRMHRIIFGLQHNDKRYVDHINRDKLDNRRSNLRIVTASENSQNQKSKGESSFRGVYFHKISGKWAATGTVNGRRSYLGLFLSEGEAGEAARKWREENMTHNVEII